ncbi:cytochrome P450 [Streptomyces sp. NPDC002537]
MPHTDRGLVRRLQLQQGLIWLAAAQGDAYAALLRGLDTDRTVHWNTLARQPLHRSATGDLVTARHAVVRAAQEETALRDQHLIDGFEGGDGADGPARPAPGAGAQAALHAPQAWEQALAAVTGEADIAALARDTAVGVLARSWGLDRAAEDDLHAAVVRTAGVLDAPFYPQNPARTREIADGLAALRRLLPHDARTDDDVVTVVAGVAVATGLVAEAVDRCAAAAGHGSDEVWERLAAEPDRAGRVVRETLRLASPLQLHAVVAVAPCELAGQRIGAGERVVLALGAANRDPEVFPDPGRFDPDRPAEQAVLVPGPARSRVLPFAEACAREGLRRLAPLRPRPVAAPVRRAAAPVSRSPIACPVATI